MENTKQNIELADIFSKYSKDFLNTHSLCENQHKALNDIIQCRSAGLGGHKEKCDHCGHTRYAYNSCRNRHCPKCQYIKQIQWVDKLKAKLPPTPYFHLVFTIPECLHKLFFLNQAKAYSCLFNAMALSLKKCAANPKFLGAQTGAVAVLHTWGQTLNYHPHIHAIVPAGGISEDRMEWVPAGKTFFLPVKVLSKIFRGILCSLLEKASDEQQMKLPDDIADFNHLKKLMYKKPWNVYAKKPLSGPKRVIEYLGKYTHKVAISNHRIIEEQDKKIIFRCKNSQTGLFNRCVSLDALEFIRRFMQHVLPAGFYKIRYLGFLSLSNSQENLSLCLELIGKEVFLPVLEGLAALEVYREITGRDPARCPICHTGILRSIPIDP